MKNADIVAVVSEYETWMRSWGASDKTIAARTTLARARLRKWGLDFDSDTIANWLAEPSEMTGRDKSKWTKATYHAHLTDFCAWLVTRSYLEVSPMDEVRSPRRPKSSPRPLSEGEIERVLGVATGRVRVWVLLAMLAGLRAGEIAALRGEDIDQEGLYVLGKGETKVTLPCHPDLWEIAQTYPRQGYWFPASHGRGGHLDAQRVSAQISQFFSALGIEGSIHRCRHVFGTRLLRSGVNIRVVQKLMRHASLATTAAYTAVDEDEMRAAVNRLHAS